MPLTTNQLTTLKADILADPALDANPNTSDGAAAIAAAYNLLATPAYWVWRTRVSKSELVQNVSVDGTTFNWTGTGFITRSVGERDAWREMFGQDGFCNPSLANVRQAFLDIFSGGTAPAPANRTHLTTMGRRTAKRAEKLFAPGVGSTAAPSLMFFEGDLDYLDVLNARALP